MEACNTQQSSGAFASLPPASATPTVIRENAHQTGIPSPRKVFLPACCSGSEEFVFFPRRVYDPAAPFNTKCRTAAPFLDSDSQIGPRDPAKRPKPRRVHRKQRHGARIAGPSFAWASPLSVQVPDGVRLQIGSKFLGR